MWKFKNHPHEREHSGLYVIHTVNRDIGKVTRVQSWVTHTLKSIFLPPHSDYANQVRACEIFL